MCASPIGFSSDIRNGRTFVRFQFSTQDIKSLTADLNFATTPAVIRSAAQVREYGRSVRDYLKSSYPENTGSRQRKSLRLKEGWRVEFYSAATVYGGVISSAASLWGFYLYHKAESSARVRTILSSLENGSRGYTIHADEAKSLMFPTSYPPNGEFGHAKSANIPARSGKGYLEKTGQYAEKLLAKHGGYLEDALQQIVEKGSRLRQFDLGASTSSGETLEDDVSATAIATLVENQNNPLGAVRNARIRLKAKRR